MKLTKKRNEADKIKLVFQKYENRKTEILESTEPITGIFYITKENRIIPDYHSEVLSLYYDPKYTQHQYHQYFYNTYIKHKYQGIAVTLDTWAMGYVETKKNNFSKVTSIVIDKMYVDNQVVLNEIKQIYRTPPDVLVRANQYFKRDQGKKD